MMWGGTPKPNEKWFTIGSGEEKYSNENVMPALRTGDSNSIVVKTGKRIVDKTDVPSTTKKDVRYEYVESDLKKIMNNANPTLDPNVLRPRDNAFIQLFPVGSRIMTLRDLGSASHEFLSREGMEHLSSQGGSLSQTLPQTTEIAKSFIPFKLLGVGGLVFSYYLYSNDNLGLGAAVGVGSICLLFAS